MKDRVYISRYVWIFAFLTIVVIYRYLYRHALTARSHRLIANSSWYNYDNNEFQNSIETVPVECQSKVRPTTGDITWSTHSKHWQIFYVPGIDITPVYAVHALYDGRPQRRPVVRSFVVAPARIPTSIRVLCFLWSADDRPEVVAAKVTNLDTSRRIVVNNTLYRQYLITCPLPSSAANKVKQLSIVSSVDDSSDKCEVTLTTLLPITYPAHPSNVVLNNHWQHEFGMCVMISYGTLTDTEADWMIEWFEFNKLMGVTEINIYNGTLQLEPRVSRIFEYYRQSGLLKVTHQPPPLQTYPPDEYKMAAKLATRSALNECLYRNMYRHHYTLVVDMDEIIVPKKHDNYTQLMKPLRNTGYNNTSLLFKSSAFYMDYPADDTKFLRSMRYRFRQPADTKRPKSILNPRRCLFAFAHHCLQSVHGSPRRRRVSPTLAVVHHYRKSCYSDNNPDYWSRARCERLAARKRRNYNMVRFKDSLLDKVMTVIETLAT